ncbi:MAG: hypothetical protein SPL89_06735 [Clostridia bacterium]|nr:hypothetical protein [Clostridia bacterium]
MPDVGMHCRKQSVCFGKPEATAPAGADRSNSGHGAFASLGVKELQYIMDRSDIHTIMDIYAKIRDKQKKEILKNLISQNTNQKIRSKYYFFMLFQTFSKTNKNRTTTEKISNYAVFFRSADNRT